MTDIRLVNVVNLAGIWVDILFNKGRLDETQELATAVVVALLTDRLADVDDILPDPDSTDKRGWWGDTDAETIWDGWQIGCKNWLFARSKITGPNAQQGSTVALAQAYTRDALQPFIDKAICSAIDVNATRRNTQEIDVTVIMYRGPREDIELRFQGLWTEIEGNK